MKKLSFAILLTFLISNIAIADDDSIATDETDQAQLNDTSVIDSSNQEFIPLNQSEDTQVDALQNAVSGQ